MFITFSRVGTLLKEKYCVDQLEALMSHGSGEFK